MRFRKMHGIGNDFVVVDATGEDGFALAEEGKRRAAEICDRRFGIGGDGLILILPADDGLSDNSALRFRMRMYNPDGSEAEMCGNGIRCFAKYLHDNGLTDGELELPIQTGAGTLTVQMALAEDGTVDTVRVDMGEPVLVPSRIPTTLGTGDGPLVSVGLPLSVRDVKVTTVSMGNPHAVVFVDDVAVYPVAEVGRLVENHPAFPRRTNTEFIAVRSDREIDFRVWERGAGETLACGTGACAAVVACVLNGRTGSEVTVHLPGGDLLIEWSASDNHVYMTGPAADVFEGEIS